MTCPHENTEPVETSGEVVARICSDCLEQLPAAWGCEDCEWVEGPRRLSDATPRLTLAGPCSKHWRNA